MYVVHPEGAQRFEGRQAHFDKLSANGLRIACNSFISQRRSYLTLQLLQIVLLGSCGSPL